MANQEKIDSDRRGVIAAAALPLLIFGLGSRANAAEACYDVKALTAGQRSLRAGVKFRASTDPVKKCGTCMYFSGNAAACGKCSILLNGPVSGSDVCDSWTKKA